MRNIEMKAKISDYDGICKRAEQISDYCELLINQEDIFYNVEKGRMKLRFMETSATLVRYDRDDENGPKLSEYDLLSLSLTEAKQLDAMLQKCLGVRGRVVKERKLYTVDQTRVHIDRVQNLGDFMELEVVLRPDQTVVEGQEIARCLQYKLGVKDEDLIDCAYVDLLDKASKS